MAHTTYTPTHIRTSDGIRLDTTAYTHTDLLVWQEWARMVATHPMVRQMGMVGDAQARVDRLQAGIVIDVDIAGLQDWAESEGWTVADAVVLAVAEANPKAVRKDIDALLEVGEVDMETVLQGYLWDAVVAEVGDMDEDTEDAMVSAIVDYYCDQMADMDEDC